MRHRLLSTSPLGEGWPPQAVGVCPGCNRSEWLAQCDTPPALTGVPLSERGRLARHSLLSTSPLGEGWPPQAVGVCPGCNRRVCAGAVRHPPALTGVPLSERGRLARMLYTARTCIYVPSRRGVAAAGGRGVSRMQQTIGAGAVRHTSRPSGRTPLREGTADAHYIRLGLVSTSPLGEG